MPSVQLSTLDGQVYIALGNLPVDKLDEVVEAQNRDHVIAGHLADLNASHQAHRIKPTPFTTSGNLLDYPMPADFGNAVYAQYSENVAGITCWRPLDIVDFTTLQMKKEGGYPAIAFYQDGPAKVRLSRVFLSPTKVEVWYNDSGLPIRLDSAVMPIQDIFLPKVVTEIALLCLPHADIPDAKRANLAQSLSALDLQWIARWNKLINRAPSHGPANKQTFNHGRSLMPWSSGGLR